MKNKYHTALLVSFLASVPNRHLVMHVAQSKNVQLSLLEAYFIALGITLLIFVFIFILEKLFHKWK